MNSLQELKKILLGMDEYHLEERAERLEEIGGPGVGGLELRYCPHFITRAETEKDMTLMALQDSISDLWNEATMCYIDGRFRACVVLVAALLETALKFELERRCIDYPEQLTLGPCIGLCKKHGILPKTEDDPVTEAALKVNRFRNDVVHANIQRRRPASLLGQKGPEHEVKRVRDPSKYIKGGAITGNGETISLGPGGLSIVYWYKTAAKNALELTGQVFKSLYPG